MSFLYRTVPVVRTAARPSTRLFSTSVIQQKTATDTVKDGLKKVDRTVSDAAVGGIDKGVELKDKAASIVGSKASEAQGEASKVAGQAQGKAAELKGEAKGKAEEIKGEIKGKI